MKSTLKLIIGVLILACTVKASAKRGENAAPKLKIDWESFLSRSDPFWFWTSTANQPVKWYHSSFVGNGEQGMMIRVDSQSPNNKLIFVVSSSAVWDDRMPGGEYSMGNFVYDRPRLPVGQFTLTTKGTIFEGSMRLDLYNGQVRGSVQTSQGIVTFLAFANAHYDSSDVMVVQADLQGGEADIGNNDVFVYTAKPAESTWAERTKDYVPNPPAEAMNISGCQVSLQMHLSGAAHATAYQEDRTRSPWSLTAVLTISISHVLPMDAAQSACKQVANARALGLEAVQKLSNEWWNAYYPASFMTFSDTVMESFYWIQMYKLASGTRSDRKVYDLMGPWFIDGTVWPDLHWDLNVQLTYYPLYAANRLDIAESLKKLLDNNIQALINNVPEKYRSDSAAAPTGASSDLCMETCYWDYGANCTTSSPSVVGNLMWTLQLYYLHYRYSMDTQVAEDVYPLLRRAVNYYTRIQYFENWNNHLPVTYSPEYPGNRSTDTNYDLALYRWGLETAIALSKLLNIDEPNLQLWTASLSLLTPYSMDSEGNYGIAAGVPFSIGHRHFSHLFMVWPLSTIDWEDESAVATGRQSVDHWLNVSLHSGLTGFCRPPFAVMSMLFGRRESVYTNLTYLIDNYILPNTFYHEGENGACGETPPMAASALQDMMLYYWDKTIHVFAGIDPRKIPDASFHHLRTEGGYLVSSVYTKGATQWIYIQYDSPNAPLEDLLIRTDMTAPYTTSPSSVKVTQNAYGILTVEGLKAKGDTVMIYSSSGSEPDFSIAPVAPQEQFLHYWGYHSKPSSVESFRDLPKDVTVISHRNTPNVFTFRSPDGLCLAVSGCPGEQAASVAMANCLQPGQTRCPTYCDACEQNWIAHKQHLVSQATGQCIQFTTDTLAVSHVKCPFSVTPALLHPEEAFPWVPPVHTSAVFNTNNATQFLLDNDMVTSMYVHSPIWSV